jgi:hypothetical protein
VKHNKFGEVVWDRVISADSNLIARDILLLDDTGYVILASTANFTTVFITDFSGTILKKNSYKYTFGNTIEKDYDALGDFSGYIMSSMINSGIAFYSGGDRWKAPIGQVNQYKPTAMDGALTRLDLNLEVNSLTLVYSNQYAVNTRINRNSLTNAIVAKDGNGQPVGYVGLVQMENDSIGQGSTDLHLVKLDLSGNLVSTLLIGQRASTTKLERIDLGVKVVQCIQTNGKPLDDKFIVLGASNMRHLGNGTSTPPMDMFITKVDLYPLATPVIWHRWIGLSVAGGDGEFLGYDIIPIQNPQGDWDGHAILGSLHDNSWNCGGGMHKPFLCRIDFDGRNYTDNTTNLQAQVFPDNRMYENLTALSPQPTLSLLHRGFIEDNRNYTTKHGFCRTNDGGYTFVTSGAGKFYKQYCLTKTDDALSQECSNGMTLVDSMHKQADYFTYDPNVYDSSETQNHLTHQHSLSKEISLIHWDHCCRDYGDTYSQCVNQEYERHDHVGLVRIGQEDEPEGRLGWNDESLQQSLASIVPNPSGESPAKLQLQEKTTGSVSIYNEWGVLVASPIELNYQNSVTLPNNMVSGLYFVRVQLASQTQTLKWVVYKP